MIAISIPCSSGQPAYVAGISFFFGLSAGFGGGEPPSKLDRMPLHFLRHQDHERLR
jgi:hypothetical protein